MNPIIIETKRLRIIAGTAEITHAAIHNRLLFSELLHAIITPAWPHELLKDAEPFFAEVLVKDPDSAGWWIWYVTLKDIKNGIATLIGNVGFKGRPHTDGTVELGYSILDEFQRNGYGLEATRALIDWAFKNDAVSSITAETFPDLIPSIQIMKKCGMTFDGPGSEEGTIRYRMNRSELSWV